MIGIDIAEVNVLLYVVQVSDGEIKTLLGGFSNSTTFQQNGVTVGGIKYMYLQSDDNQIQGKKGATGVSVAKAGKCESKDCKLLDKCSIL